MLPVVNFQSATSSFVVGAASSSARLGGEPLSEGVVDDQDVLRPPATDSIALAVVSSTTTTRASV